MLDLRLVNSSLDYSPLHLCPVGMQLHLVFLESGADLRKITFGENKFSG